VAVRPEHVRFVAPSEPGRDGRIEQVTYLGPVRRYRIVLGDGAEIRVTQSADEPAESGDVRLSITDRAAVALAVDVVLSTQLAAQIADLMSTVAGDRYGWGHTYGDSPALGTTSA
jgi:hypothetical protein